MNRLFTFALGALLLLWATLLSACSAATAPEGNPAPSANLPAKYQNAPARVREAYQFALSNPEALKNVPCYCGCGAIGHTSNYSCYIQGTGPDGAPQFDDHALGCSICVDIAQDVRRYTREGKSAKEIHDLIVQTYEKFGPPNQ